MVEHNDHDRDAAFKTQFNTPDVTTEPAHFERVEPAHAVVVIEAAVRSLRVVRMWAKWQRQLQTRRATLE